MVGVFLQFLSTPTKLLLVPFSSGATSAKVFVKDSQSRQDLKQPQHMACLSIVLHPSWKWKVEAWPNTFPLPLRTSEARSSPWESGEKRISNLCTTVRVEMPPCARNKHTKFSKKGNTSLYFNILQSSMNYERTCLANPLLRTWWGTL